MGRGFTELSKTRRLVNATSKFFDDHPAVLDTVLIGIVVVVANALYLVGVFKPNPLYQFSGLATNAKAGLAVGYNSIDPNAAYTAQALGHRAALDWLHGHVPLWNHYEGIGTPLAGEMQAAAFFPLVLLLAVSNGQLYFYILLQIIAGVATCRLLRRIGLGTTAALVGGAVFALNGTFSWFRYQLVNPIAFLPLILLGIERSLERSRAGRKGGWGLIAVAVALSLYAGFPEAAYIDGLLAAVWVIARMIQIREGRTQFVMKIGLGVATGILLAAPILAAFVAYLPHQYIGGHVSGGFAGGSLPRGASPMLIVPYVYGPLWGFAGADHTGLLGTIWGNVGGYLTSALLLLVLVGVVGRRDRVLRLALAGWLVLALGRTFGVPGVTQVVNAVPLVGQTVFHRYSGASWEMAATVLAALGLDDILSGRARRSSLVTAVIVALIAVSLAGMQALPVLGRLDGAPHHRAWALGGVGWAAITVLAVAVAGGFRRFGARLLPIVILLDALVFFVTPQFSARRQVRIDNQLITYLRHNLGSYRFFTLGPLQPNYGSYFGLASVATNDLPPKLWSKYIRTHLNSNTDTLVFDGVSRLNATGPTPAEELMAHLEDYESIGVKYVLLPAGFQLPPAPSGSGALTTVYRDDLAEVIELPDPAPYFETSHDAGCTVVMAASATSVTTACDQRATLLRRELYMPGWRAERDGRSLPLEQEGIFQKVTVPPGRSTIVFRFSPPYWSFALGAFGLGLIIIVTMSVRTARNDYATAVARRPT